MASHGNRPHQPPNSAWSAKPTHQSPMGMQPQVADEGLPSGTTRPPIQHVCLRYSPLVNLERNHQAHRTRPQNWHGPGGGRERRNAAAAEPRKRQLLSPPPETVRTRLEKPRPDPDMRPQGYEPNRDATVYFGLLTSVPGIPC